MKLGEKKKEAREERVTAGPAPISESHFQGRLVFLLIVSI